MGIICMVNTRGEVLDRREQGYAWSLQIICCLCAARCKGCTNGHSPLRGGIILCVSVALLFRGGGGYVSGGGGGVDWEQLLMDRGPFLCFSLRDLFI